MPGLFPTPTTRQLQLTDSPWVLPGAIHGRDASNRTPADGRATELPTAFTHSNQDSPSHHDQCPASSCYDRGGHNNRRRGSW
jgi:hypothetical protein